MEPKAEKDCFASPELAVAALRGRYFRITLLSRFLRNFTILNFSAGACFLILRQTGYSGDLFRAVFLCGLAMAAGLAYASARRQTSEQRGWLAAIDAHNCSGGLLMATEETGDQGWHDRLPGRVEIPLLKTAAGNRYASAGISLFFLLLSLTIPLIGPDAHNDPRIELQELERAAAGQIEILADEGIISPEEARQLNESLERIGLDSQRHDPAATFEALDQLQEKLKKQAGASVLKNLSEQSGLEELSELAGKMSKAAGLNNSQISELAGAVSRALEEAAAGATGSGTEKLQRALEKAAAGGPESAEAAREAAEALKEYIAEQQAKAAAAAAAAAQRLAAARLIDRKTFEALKKAGKIKPATGADLQPGSQSDLVMCEGEGSGAGGSAQQGESGGANGSGGKGGGEAEGSGQTGSGNESGSGASGLAGRGGGHAPLNFDRKSSEHNVEFKNEVLPAPNEQALERSVAIGMSFSAPQTAAGPEDQGSGAGVAWQKTSEGGAESGIIMPRHRSAVKKYFDHEQQ